MVKEDNRLAEKVAEPSGAATRQDAAPQEGMPDGEPDAVPYRKLFRLGWYVVSGALGWFLINTFLSISLQILTQYNVQVLAIVVSGLGSAWPGGEAASPAGSVANMGGFLSGLLPDNLQTAALVFVSLALLLILIRFLDQVIMNWSDNVMAARLQQRLHDKLLRLGPSYHQSHDLGETMLIVTRFAIGSQLFLRDLISFPVVRGISLVTALIFLANNLIVVGKTPFWMQATLLATIFILPVGGWKLSLMLRQAFQKVRDSEMAMANEFSNSASLPLEVQAMGAERQRSQAFGKRLRTYIRFKMAAAVRQEIARQFETSTPVFLQTVFLIYGVFFALQSGNPAAAGAILAIYYFVPEAVSPLQQIIEFCAGLQANWPQVEKVVEILDREPEVKEKSNARALSPTGGSLVLENLSFAYSPQGPKILDNLSYAFPPGRITAIVARAGMGKSTLLNLVVRLRDPQGGRILVDGQDIADVTLASLRRHVAKVSQFPLFVADTIRTNLKLANPGAADVELEEVCRRTGLWQVLENAAAPHTDPLEYVLPHSAGEGLSGGQRRLLAVTRAFLLRPAILLLDEPTTGIDAIGRAQVAGILREVCRGLTVLLVDHDVEFISHFADWICCLEAGRFTAVGPPKELAERAGLFRDLLAASDESRPQPQGEQGNPAPR